MELWYMDVLDNKCGPIKAVAQDKSALYIQSYTNEILIAIPKILVVAKIEDENEQLPEVEKYVLEHYVLSIDFRLLRLINTTN